MRTITKTLRTFNELSPKEKTAALDTHRYWNTEGFEWWDFEDFKTCASILGITIEDIRFSGFSSQGDGASFTGSFCWPEKNIPTAMAGHAPIDPALKRMALEAQRLFAASFYTACGSITQGGRRCHEYTMDLDFSRYDEIKGRADEEEWLTLFRDFAKWIYKQLETHYRYLTSDEAIAESLIANEFEFESAD